jgi:hypothetical protein
MRSMLGAMSRRRAAAPPPPAPGGIEFDSASAMAIEFEATVVETSSFTVASGSNRYLLSFTGALEFGVASTPTGVTAPGSGGSSLTALMSQFAHTSTNLAGRSWGLVNPATGAVTSYATWPGLGLLKAHQALAYRGVASVSQAIGTFRDEEAATSYIELTLDTPNVGSVAVGMAFATNRVEGITLSAGTGNTDRGGTTHEIPIFAARTVERARAGSTTTLRVDSAGSDFYSMVMIGVVLEPA